MKNKLSEKPSEAIKQALEDLKACIEDPNYIINFTDWHSPRYVDHTDQFGNGIDRKVCEVCFAGAVMAKTFECPIEEEIAPSAFDKRTEKMFSALDNFRAGNVESGLSDLYGYEKTTALFVEHNLPKFIPVNQRNQDEFFEDLERMSNLLEQAGL